MSSDCFLPTRHPSSLNLHIYMFVGRWSAVLQKGPCYQFSSFVHVGLGSSPLYIPSYVYSFLIFVVVHFRSTFLSSLARHLPSLNLQVYMFVGCWNGVLSTVLRKPMLIFCVPRFSSFAPLCLSSGPLWWITILWQDVGEYPWAYATGIFYPNSV